MNNKEILILIIAMFCCLFIGIYIGDASHDDDAISPITERYIMTGNVVVELKYEQDSFHVPLNVSRVSCFNLIKKEAQQ